VETLSDPEEEPYSIIFASLKHPVRRKILRMLSEKSMTFSEMLDVLKVSSPFLTYHLENLGELVCKTGNGKYRLSTFGDTAVVTMSSVEDTSRPAFSRSSRNHNSGHKTVSAIVHGTVGIFPIVLAIGLILASLFFVNFVTSPYGPQEPITMNDLSVSLQPRENYTFTTVIGQDWNDIAHGQENATLIYPYSVPPAPTLTHWETLRIRIGVDNGRTSDYSENMSVIVYYPDGSNESGVLRGGGGYPDLIDQDAQNGTYRIEMRNTNLEEFNSTIVVHVVHEAFDKPYFYLGISGLAIAVIGLVLALLYPIVGVSEFLWGSLKRPTESKMQPENLSPVQSTFKGEVLDKQLVAKLSKKYTHPEQALRYWLERKMSQGKTREQALKEIEEENA
jgi:hypothetical protein